MSREPRINPEPRLRVRHRFRPRGDTLGTLSAAGLDVTEIERIVGLAIDEDLGPGEDVTSIATVPIESRSTADVVIREPGVLGGVPVMAAVLEMHLGPEATVTVIGRDGYRVQPGDVIATVEAPTMPLLTIERTMLNILCRLSGISTLTRRWVDAVEGTGTRIRDTRKTTPGLRHLEKYAVRCGGGVNHRLGLYDAVLIKDNHVVAAGGVGAALDAVNERFGGRNMVIQVEIDRLDQLREALAHGATEILLDNMAVADMAKAVQVVRKARPEVLLEASGGLQLENARRVAETGVDFLAVGALTHSAPILDIALDFRV